MKNKLSKIIILLLIIMMIFSSNPVFAVPPSNVEQTQKDDYSAGGGGGGSSTPDENEEYHDPISDPKYYFPNGVTDESSSAFVEKIGGILGVISTVGIICSVIVLCIIGLRYMLGSVEEKAEYKKTMLGYIIGVALLASATTIPNILYNYGIKMLVYTTAQNTVNIETTIQRS